MPSAFIIRNFSSAFCHPQFFIRIPSVATTFCRPHSVSSAFIIRNSPAFCHRQFSIHIPCHPYFVISFCHPQFFFQPRCQGLFPGLGKRLFSFRIYPSPFSAIRILLSALFHPNFSVLIGPASVFLCFLLCFLVLIFPSSSVRPQFVIRIISVLILSSAFFPSASFRPHFVICIFSVLILSSAIFLSSSFRPHHSVFILSSTSSLLAEVCCTT